VTVGVDPSYLVMDTITTLWTRETKDQLIELLEAAGLTVRYYDSEEKQWMDKSMMYGLVRAPGDRDGRWGAPTRDVFERDYLAVV